MQTPSSLQTDIRNPYVVWYGPHSCAGCGTTIIQRGTEYGPLLKLDCPHNHHYPNHEWTQHECSEQLPKHMLPAGTLIKLAGFPFILNHPTEVGSMTSPEDAIAATANSTPLRAAGGHARAKSLTPEKRKSIASKAAKTRWGKKKQINKSIL